MGWRLASPGERPSTGWLKRFDPRFWTVNFPRPMMAAVTTTGAQSLAVDALFYKANDLAGLIWAAQDDRDHPLAAYETDRDFRGCTLSFRWQSTGVMALDQVNGPTLTIEGRDASGAARSWYVRLWNYADGSPEDAAISLDFDALDGGFLLPGEADPVWAGDVDRMFVSLVAPGYTNLDVPLAAPVEGHVALSDIVCDGRRSVLAIGTAMVPAHSLRIATGYDDCYDLTPARVMRGIVQLGYRGIVNHYVGMSHYFRLARDGADLLATAAGGVLNAPCAAWHASFAAEAKALGFDLILSLSYELLDQHCPEAWKQRAADGSPALTGWVPPSTLLSPANDEAMAYLRSVAQAFVAIPVAAGLAPRFQIGEPWWWVMADGRPCLYDEAAVIAFGGAPAVIASVRGSLDTGQKALLDSAGTLLATSTAALRDAVRSAAPGAQVLLLAYLPSVLDPATPEIRRANLPLGWTSPAYDILQLEDYDWVTAGNLGATASGVAAAQARLGYAPAATHYFSGFVADAGHPGQWALVAAAADAGRARGHGEIFVWALPQVARDGFTHFELGDQGVQAFDDIAFPIAIGSNASVEPGFSTAIVASAAGIEQRNVDWAQARLRFDAGPGLRSEADIQALVSFFRARRGAARAFRFRDPFDDSSNGMTGDPGFLDQAIATGDGTATRFPLVKLYGAGGEAEARRITRPVAGSVRVGVAGAERLTGWTLADGGIIQFDTAPAAGAAITAGYRFDVPVRFEQDQLQVSLASVTAGEAPEVPLVEVREAFA